MDRHRLAGPTRMAVDRASPMWVTSIGTGALKTRSTRKGSAQAKAHWDIQTGTVRRRQRRCTRGGEI